MLVQSPEQYEYFSKWLNEQSIVGIDTETTGLNAYIGSRVAGVSLAGRDGESFYIPFRHGSGTNLDMSYLPDLIEKINGFRGRLVYWNAKFDLVMKHFDGMQIPGPSKPGIQPRIEDAMIAAHLLNENEPNFQLKSTADRYGVGRGSLDEEDLFNIITTQFKLTPEGKRVNRKNWKSMIWCLSPELVAPYAETDAVLTILLRDFYYEHLKKWTLQELYHEVCDYLLTLTRMELRGLLLDIDRLNELRAQAVVEAEKIQERLSEVTGRVNFNPNSVPQLQSAFGWGSTREEVLLAESNRGNPNAQLVLDYRAWTKVVSTYYDVWDAQKDDKNCIRTDMNIIGTKTGRLSSRNPNLQAVPRETNIYRVKETVVARPGMALIEMDLSGAELRLACLSPDTLVDTPLGPVAMRDLRKGDKVWAHDKETRKPIISTVEASQPMGHKRCYRITFDNGESVIASYDHRWPVRRHIGSNGWEYTEVTTEELSVGERMIPLRRVHGLNHTVTSIEPIGDHEVWNISVDNDHTYFLSCGVLTHNSHYANEVVMGEILARGGDIHTETATALNIPRAAAKTVNFSAVYGIGAKTFSNTYGYDFETSKKYLSAYHKRYPGFKRLYYAVQNVAEERGYIRLDTGRIRRYVVRGMVVAETHKASSNWVQGTVGEVMRIAMHRIAVAMDGRDAHLLLTVHDSLLAEVPEDEVEYWVCLMAAAMTDFNFDPPLAVETKVGTRWGELKHMEVPAWATARPSKYLPNYTHPTGEPEGFRWWRVEDINGHHNSNSD